MRFKSVLLSSCLIALPVACERNKTTVVRTAPAQPAPDVEARIEPVPEPVEPAPDLERDLETNLPEERPAEPTEDPTDDTGIDGDRPAPNVEAGPEEPITNPPR